MLNTEAVLSINTEILRSCLMAHATRDFSGDLRFAHAGETFTWKRVEFHSDRQDRTQTSPVPCRNTGHPQCSGSRARTPSSR